MRGKSIKIKNALKTIENDDLRTKIVKPQNLFVSSAVSFLVAEMGFEPHDLRVMSPTSYQAAPLRDIKWCRRPGSNRYECYLTGF